MMFVNFQGAMIWTHIKIEIKKKVNHMNIIQQNNLCVYIYIKRYTHIFIYGYKSRCLQLENKAC